MVVEERLRRHLSAHKGFTTEQKIESFELFDQNLCNCTREQEVKKWKRNKVKIEALILIGNGYRVPIVNQEGRSSNFRFGINTATRQKRTISFGFFFLKAMFTFTLFSKSRNLL
jgi:hypothetical protein